MKDFLLILVMIFPFIWIGMAIWIMTTKNTHHWLYKSWLYLHVVIISFFLYSIVLSPLILVTGGFIAIPLAISGKLKILKALSFGNLKLYKRYSIISIILLSIISLTTSTNRLEQPNIFVVILGILLWFISIFLLFSLSKNKGSDLQ